MPFGNIFHGKHLMPNYLKGFILFINQVKFLISCQHATDSPDEFRSRHHAAVFDKPNHILLWLIGNNLLHEAAQAVDIIGQEQP